MTNSASKNEHLHDGHRSRMRAKLINYGERVLETYELFEMLLYTPIRYRDTNPVAKRLFKRYKTLDEIFAAPIEELTATDGIGEKTAQFISEVGRSAEKLDLAYNADVRETFDNFRKTGEYFIDYFKGKNDPEVVMLLLDNKFALIEKISMHNGDYGSAGVKPKDFVNKALQYHASVAIIAHNHPYGPIIATESDIATNRAVFDALVASGVFLAESYLVCGESYTGMVGTNKYQVFSQCPDIMKFFKSNGWLIPALRAYPAAADSVDVSNTNGTEVLTYLSSLLSYTNKTERAKAISVKLLSKYTTLRDVFSIPIDELVRCSDINEADAIFLKIIAHILSRRISERFENKKRYTEDDFLSYVKSLFIGKQIEQIYALFFDDNGIFAASELVSDGTVNSSGVVPRKLIELAMKHKASKIVLAHNHPQGTTEPSNEDLMLTTLLRDTFRNLGIVLTDHYVVAGNSCKAIPIN